MTARDEILALIRNAGFESVGGGINVGGVRFVFDEVLIGTRARLSLVLIEFGSEWMKLRARVTALSRALDHVSSKLTISIVTFGRPDRGIFEELSLYGRVIVVSPDESFSDSLRVLYPVDSPRVAGERINAMSELASNTSGTPSSTAFLALAESRDVSEALRAYLLEPLIAVED